MADWLEGYVAMQVHAPIRFGKWREILAMPLPEDPILYCTTTAMLHYARGLAHAVLEDVPAAEVEQSRFEAAVARVPSARIVFNNTCLDILAIAARMLHGEVSYRAAITRPHSSIFALRSGSPTRCPTTSPGAGCSPPRHALGALLLEQGRVEEAEAVYRADLGLGGDAPAACRSSGSDANAGGNGFGLGGWRCPDPGLSASRQRLEPARLSRMPRARGGSRPRPRWWPRGSLWRWRGRTCRSGPRACAGAGACPIPLGPVRRSSRRLALARTGVPIESSGLCRRRRVSHPPGPGPAGIAAGA